MFISFLNQFVREEDGQDMVEYALLLAFIALAATAMLGSVKNSLNLMWGNINNKLGSTANTIT